MATLMECLVLETPEIELIPCQEREGEVQEGTFIGLLRAGHLGLLCHPFSGVSCSLEKPALVPQPTLGVVLYPSQTSHMV